MSNIHVIDGKNKSLLFNGENFKVYELNSHTRKIFSLYEDGYEREEIADKLNLSEKEVKSCFKLVVNNNSEVLERNDKILGAYLMISQDCNLRCKYCYADYGKYGGKSQLMSENVAKKSIDYLVKINNNLKFIQFFGGEPSLNVNIIEFSINYFKSLYNKRKIKRIPMFSIVSNLVNINDNFIKLVKDNHINITVSIDGPKEIHDTLRCKVNNSGTYEDVIMNYNKLVLEGIIPNIEATYTSYHVGKITMVELYKYFHKNFKYETIFISPIACSKTHDLYIKDKNKLINERIEAMEVILDSMITDDAIKSANIQNILEQLLTKKTNNENFYICPDAAGICQLAINVDGDVFPCYALVNKDSLKMENIFLNDKLKFKNQQDRFLNFNKNNEPCKKCWIKNLCSICLASQVFIGKEYGSFDTNICAEKKLFIERLISKLIEIQNTEENIEKFNANFYLNDKN